GNFFSFVPLQLQNILRTEAHIALLRTARAILVGGGPVAEETRQKIQELQLPVFETYGMTETISHIALKDLRTGDPFFTALPGVSLDTDEQACLKIKSPSTLDQWVSTHDVVERISEGKFILKGRRDNIINSGAVKIQAEEVERAIAQAFPGLPDFFCYGLPDDILGQRLVLVIEGDGPEPDLSLLDLPRYHVPKAVIRVKQFVKTPSGKTDKHKTIAS
ncbi:MAG: O-succinylbenzoic acid--CoA ligase, partial [Leadbetterella sp.]|nr:O-succinylbenzoic acid--CoA ligase [Leadbetterella sp.]